jgi:hypothetical protein
LGFVILLAPACGKKGPPLAPIVRIPTAVENIRTERVGSDVYVTLTIPEQNIDKSTPADVARVDVYAVTSTTPPSRGEFLAQASRVAQVPVIPLLDDGSVKPATDGAPQVGAAQGTMITVHDALTPDQLVPKPPIAPARPARGAARAAVPLVNETATAGPPLPQRFYMAIAFSERGRPGPPGAVADVPLAWLPPPPTLLAPTPQGDEVIVSWEPSGGPLGFVLDNALPIEPPPFDQIADTTDTKPLASDVPPGPTRYNVYRADPPDRDRAAAPPWSASHPTPLNAEPLLETTFSDPAQFGQTQCYVVRALRGAPGAEVEGEPSEPQCVTPVDTVPPAPPSNLRATSQEGSISLIWDPNTELDLAGYLVLRGEAGSATLQPLNDAPLVQPQYTDRAVVPGTRYVYAVVAVDDAPMPNRSGESNREEATAR